MSSQRTSPLGRSLSLRNPVLWIVVIILFLLGLDFVGWSTGGKSFLFSLILGERFAPPGSEELVQIVRQEMARQKIPLKGLHRFTDSAGNLHLKIDLQPAEYNRLAPDLEKSLLAANSAILVKQEEREKKNAYFLWGLKAKKGTKALILFSCGGERLLAGRRPQPGAKAKLVRGPVRVALILDDMGYSLDKARAVCELDLPLAVSILPFSPFDVESAQIAHEQGLEVLLHLPMESKNHHDTEKFTRGLIEARLSDDEIRKRVRDDIYQVPYIRGVNNHMGSLLTEDAAKMERVLGVLREFSLFFIDSRTSLNSKAYDVARRLHIPAASNDLFLDAAEETADKVKQNLGQLFSLAQERGWAVGICHPYEGTLEALRSLPILLEKSGVILVPPSQIAGASIAK